MTIAENEAWLARVTGARYVKVGPNVQSLWGGYGRIVRYRLFDAAVPSVIVKQIEPPRASMSQSHARKLRSYEVEMAFYERQARSESLGSRVAHCWGSRRVAAGWWLVLEDLDAAGFQERIELPSAADLRACLAWLAHFHADFLNVAPEGLWPVGCYWHLETRPDELAAVRDARLRQAAAAIEARLSRARFQTLVHGDAKAENFCLAREQARAAAVDFQYVGGGPGIKDVAYFLGSCLSPQQCSRQAPLLLDYYFEQLLGALMGRDVDGAALEVEWRALYPLAWADFHRFLSGWSPGQAASDSYAARLTAQVLDELEAPV